MSNHVGMGDHNTPAPQLFHPAGWKGVGQPPLYTAEQVAALADAPAQERARLEKPARVGHATFGTGVEARLVVEVAQRAFEIEGTRRGMTPEQMIEQERARRTLWEMIHGPLTAQEHATQLAGQGQEDGCECVNCANGMGACAKEEAADTQAVPTEPDAFEHFVSDCDGAGIQYDSASYEAGFRTGRTAAAPAQAQEIDRRTPPDTLVNGGALKMALNVLRRAGKTEVADELEKTATPAQAQDVQQDARDAGLLAFIETVGHFKAQRLRVGSPAGAIRWDVEYGHYGHEARGKTLAEAIEKAIDAARAAQGGA